MGISDKITDGIASKLAGKKIQTVEVSLEDVMNRLDNVLNEVGADEIPLIEKVVKGSFFTALKLYDTKSEKYRISTLYAGTIGSNRLVNEFSIMDLEEGKIYTYKAFLFKGKIKKAGRNIIDKHK
ncbi:MAG: hypothetical protein E7278_05380 [Lachnospiraceae bacterium]|jgi:hypothetical protein|nr:hypothetical protein [Lachnospiraceae bacterium]